MDMVIRVIKDGEQVDFDVAVSQGQIVLNNNGIRAKNGVVISRCSELLDGNGKMIYEHDVLIDRKGDKYTVLYYQGNFILKNMQSSLEHTPFLLSAFKLNSKIDTLFVI